MRIVVVLLVASTIDVVAAEAVTLPACFEMETVVSGFTDPVAIAFAPNDRIFVAEQGGRVWLVHNGVALPDPFIDLRDEVGDARDRGLTGLAVDPEFAATPWVYLLYVVDPVFGEPDEPATTATFGRLTRYLADPKTGGTTALLDSRQVLIGARPSEGFIHCFASHAVGTLRFGSDGTLFAGAGEGADFNVVDPGGLHPGCFVPELFDAVYDIGAFRAQDLDALAGKILRIDPNTGGGLPTNPYWTGNPEDTESKVWAYGLRNPFRFSIRPGTPRETLYIGDVGWNAFEEIDVATGGENFGWPCYEGIHEQPGYFDAKPAHHDCTTISSKLNPGPLTAPLTIWHHTNLSLSIPPGFRGRCAVGGAFYTGGTYPSRYVGHYFFGDFVNGWIDMLEVSAANELVSLAPFATGLSALVAIETHPVTGDLYVVRYDGTVRHIRYEAQAGDDDEDCDVDLADARSLFLCLDEKGVGTKPGCQRFDLDGDNQVGLADYAALELTGPGD